MNHLLQNIMNRASHSLGRRRLTQKMFYIHLPKCGGTSIRKAIRLKYQSLDPRIDGRLHSIEALPARQAVALTGISTFQFRETYLLYLLARPSTLCVSGHLPFSDIAFQEFSDSYRFVTLLRHPVQRWLSQYFHHLMNDPQHPDKTDQDLEAFVESSEAVDFGSIYVRTFVGRDIQPEGVTSSDIDAAKNNLGRMHLVGQLERLVEFVQQFESEFGVTLNIPHLNASRATKKQQSDRVSKSLLQKIERVCAPDLEVYYHQFPEQTN